MSLAPNSDHTYDLTLAILFLARQQKGRRGEADPLIRDLAERLAAGDRGGIWDYSVPDAGSRDRHISGAIAARHRSVEEPSAGAGLGVRRPFEYAVRPARLVGSGPARIRPRRALESIDHHFRSTQIRDGRWGYKPGMGGTESMSCAGLMALAITAATAEPGGTPDGPGSGSGPRQGSGLCESPARRCHRCSGRRHSLGDLLSLVARASLRRPGASLARRLRLVRPRCAHPARSAAEDGGWGQDRWGRLPDTSPGPLIPPQGESRIRARSCASPDRRQRPRFATARRMPEPDGPEMPK